MTGSDSDQEKAGEKGSSARCVNCRPCKRGVCTNGRVTVDLLEVRERNYLFLLLYIHTSERDCHHAFHPESLVRSQDPPSHPRRLGPPRFDIPSYILDTYLGTPLMKMVLSQTLILEPGN